MQITDGTAAVSAEWTPKSHWALPGKAGILAEDLSAVRKSEDLLGVYRSVSLYAQRVNGRCNRPDRKAAGKAEKGRQDSMRMLRQRRVRPLRAWLRRQGRLRLVLRFSRRCKDPETIEDIHALRGGPGKPGPFPLQ